MCEAQFAARAAGDMSAVNNDALDAGADRLVKYCMDMVHSLTAVGVIPYLVFDGDSLPAKKATEADRLACVFRWN